ncbi:MAG: DUF2058 family protein [Granulosicoccus sp.]|nr:DUF2058 family protein [Granulosicoccus sp.]
MSDSLRDQLLNAGFSPPKESSRPRQRKSGGHGHRTPGAEGKRQPANSNTLVKANGSSRKVERHPPDVQLEARRTLKASIRKLIEDAAIREYQGDSVFRFILNKRIRELHVRDDIRQQLIAGSLVITRLNGATWLVPDECASAIRTLNPEWTVVTPATQADVADEQDGYDEFPVPDDLQW